MTGQPDRHAQPVPERAQQDCWRAFRGAEPEEQAQSQQAGRTGFPGNFEHAHVFSVCYTFKHFNMRSPSPPDQILKFKNCSKIPALCNDGVLEQSMGAKKRIGIGLSYRPARQAS